VNNSPTYDDAMWLLNAIVSSSKSGTPMVVAELNELHRLLLEYGMIGAIHGRVEQVDGATFSILIPSQKGERQIKACRRAWSEEIANAV